MTGFLFLFPKLALFKTKRGVVPSRRVLSAKTYQKCFQGLEFAILQGLFCFMEHRYFTAFSRCLFFYSSVSKKRDESIKKAVTFLKMMCDPLLSFDIPLISNCVFHIFSKRKNPKNQIRNLYCYTLMRCSTFLFVVLEVFVLLH